MPKYHVAVIYVGQSDFFIEANSLPDAEDLARHAFAAGHADLRDGSEWESIARIHVTEHEPDPT